MPRVASDWCRPCHSRPCARSARESGRCLGTRLAECCESGRGTSGVESIVWESEVCEREPAARGRLGSSPL